MATINQPFQTQAEQQEKDKDKDKQGQVDSQAPSTPAPQTSPAAPTNAAPQTATATKAPSSGQFTNLQKYVSANKNFNKDQGGLAGKVAGNINQGTQQVQQNVQQANQQFGQKAQENQNSYTAIFGGNNPIAPPPTQPIGQQAPQQIPAYDPTFANAAQIAADKDKAAQLVAARDAEYKGPKSLADLQGQQSLASLQAKQQAVASQANQAQNEQGRFSLLQQMFAKPSYTAGQQNLDNVFIQSDKNQLKALQNTKQGALQAGQQINQAESTANAKAAGLTSEAQQIRAKVRSDLENAAASGDTEAQNRLAQMEQEQVAANKRLAESLKTGNFTQADADLLGLSQDQEIGADIDLNKYVSNQLLNKYNVLDTGKASQLAALQQLSGTAISPELQAKLNEYASNVGQAGSITNANLLKAQDNPTLAAELAQKVSGNKQALKAAQDDLFQSGKGLSDMYINNDQLKNQGVTDLSKLSIVGDALNLIDKGDIAAAIRSLKANGLDAVAANLMGNQNSSNNKNIAFNAQTLRNQVLNNKASQLAGDAGYSNLQDWIRDQRNFELTKQSKAQAEYDKLSALLGRKVNINKT